MYSIITIITSPIVVARAPCGVKSRSRGTETRGPETRAKPCVYTYTYMYVYIYIYIYTYIYICIHDI